MFNRIQVKKFTAFTFYRREAAEKMLSLLRRREELNEVLKEKSAKRKESKGEKVTIAYSSTTPYLQSITSIVSRFIQLATAFYFLLLLAMVFSTISFIQSKLSNDSSST